MKNKAKSRLFSASWFHPRNDHHEQPELLLQKVHDDDNDHADPHDNDCGADDSRGYIHHPLRGRGGSSGVARRPPGEGGIHLELHSHPHSATILTSPAFS